MKSWVIVDDRDVVYCGGFRAAVNRAAKDLGPLAILTGRHTWNYDRDTCRVEVDVPDSPEGFLLP